MPSYKRRSFYLLCASALVPALICSTGPAHARVHHTGKTQTKQTPVAPAAKSAPRVPHDLEGHSAESMSIRASRRAQGGGMMVHHTEAKTISTVTQDYISKQAPTVTPGVLVSSLPGVQATNEGPLSTTAETIHIRGLDQTQIGMVYEGIPLADPFTYGAYTSAMVDNENLGSVSVSQGSSDLTAPVYNADGAQMTLSLRHPADKMTAYAEASGGTHSTNKEFVRFDTGEIGHSGVRAFASGSYSSANLWRGPGQMDRWHVDAAIEKRWAPKSSSELIFGYNKANQTEWLYPTLAQWNTYGTGYNTHGTYTKGDTLYYKLNTKATNAVVGALKNHFDFGHGLTLDAEPYAIETFGPNNYGVNIPASNGYVGTQQYSSLNGYEGQTGNVTAISIHPWVQTSSGINLVGAWHRGFNTLKLSYWYSYAVHTEYQNHYPVNASGQYTENNGYLTAFNNVSVSQYNINGFQQLNAIGLEDQVKLFHDRLTIDAGLRANMISRSFSQDLPGANFKSVENMFVPIPQVLISYQFDQKNQIYVNGTTGYRAPSSFQAQVPVYSFTSANKASLPLANFQPEYMIGEEIGYRHSGDIMFNVALFNYNLTHHQITSVSYLPNSTIMISQPIDAGGESAQGVQAEISTRPWHHISAYASGQFMHTRVGNNIAYQGDYLRTKGKQEVASPKFTGALGLTYDDGTNFANFNLRYTDSQYATLMNDQSIPSYITSDISLGRYLPKIGRVRPKAMLSLMNVGDNHYLAQVNGFSGNATTTRGVYGKTLSASQPTYSVGTGFAAVVSVSGTFE
ncbi:MAG: TonB-dependent receptor [Gluconobacter cerinus]|uniref:TonB-dependent receptor n=1 Tax=Gluconobacter cerinus TaxID=38307 RepID=UPI0039E888F9